MKFKLVDCLVLGNLGFILEGSGILISVWLFCKILLGYLLCNIFLKRVSLEFLV